MAVFRAPGLFQGESAGDRILTISGGKAAYIAGARWVSPASVLFDEAVLAAFDGRTDGLRLVSRGEQSKADYALRIDVRDFEARYDGDGRGAPTVVIRLRAALSRPDRTDAGETLLESKVRASDDRISAIVAAYDKALADVLGQLVSWTGRQTSPAR